jgi:hypothetical protein
MLLIPRYGKSTRRQGWQGRWGALTSAPRPAPPSEIGAPRPAPPSPPESPRLTTPCNRLTQLCRRQVGHRRH